MLKEIAAQKSVDTPPPPNVCATKSEKQKMDIVEYFGSDADIQLTLREALATCDWRAGKFLLQLLKERTFAKTLGENGKIFFLLDGKAVVSFLTLTRQDCIAAPDMTPWIGFVFTFPEYRGRRYAGILLDHARKCAADASFPVVFLATDHVGVYEKYGFSYWGNIRDIHGENSRIYTAPAADIAAVAENTRKRAGEVIRRCGIREAWETIGAELHLVGSLATGLLMKHRDIDFHIYTDTLDMAKSREAISRICAVPHVSHLEYRDLAATEEACLEWHIRYDLDGESWQIDMIQILKGSRFDGFFENVAERIKAVLTPESRRTILELKYLTPEKEHIPGIEYCRAVLADGVRTYAEFSAWRKDHPTTGIDPWCP